MCDETISELIVATLYTNGERTAYYPIILSKCKKVASKEVGTMGVCFNRDGGLTLLYSPDFVKKITTEEAIAVLKHEAMHIFQGHLIRFKDKDPLLTNLACDVSINQYIKNLPEGGVYPETFEFEREKWAEEYYVLLKEFKKKIYEKGQSEEQGRYFEGEGKGNSLDNHEIWKKVFDQNGHCLGTTADLDIDDEEIFGKAVQQMAGEIEESCHNKGNLPAWLKKTMEHLKARKSTYNWKKEFRLLVQNLLSTEKRRSQKRVDRKLSCVSDFLFPGKRKERQPKVLIVRDTSGSCFYDEKVVQGMLDELAAISKKASAWVCDCDTEVHQLYRVKKASDFRQLEGGGGTSFVAPFKVALDGGFNAVIYMTDLCGCFPNVADVKYLARKTMWVVFENYPDAWVTSVPFGKVIKITRENS